MLINMFFCICMLTQTWIHSFIDPTQNHKKSKKIQFEFFVNKSLKIHNAKNICPRDFCLAPNERELSNLLTLSISSKGAIALRSSETFSLENENPVSLEYVKKSKTDFDFFPDYGNETCPKAEEKC